MKLSWAEPVCSELFFFFLLVENTEMKACMP